MSLVTVGRPILGLGGLNATPPNLYIPQKNPDGFFTLWARRGASETNGTASFTKVGGAAPAHAYQVTAGKTLQVVSIAYASDTTGMLVFQFMTSTAAFGSGTGPTGAVYQNGATSLYGFPVLAANTWYVMNYQYEFAATLFPGIQAATSPITAVVILCREVG